MKTNQLIGAFIIGATLISCGGDQQGKSTEELLESNNLEELKQKRDELSNQEHNLIVEIEKLSAAIAKLDTNKRMPLISVFPIVQQEFKHYVEVQGSIDTKQNVILFPEYSGVLKKLSVKEGQRVSAGQLLASIEDGGLAQQVNLAEIQLDLSKTTFERQKRLWEQKIGSEMQFLQAKATYEGQQKSVAQLKSQLAKTQITAPFSGIVDEIMIEEGNVVGPGQMGVMRIINMKQMFVEAYVPETYIAAVNKGKSVKIEIPVLNSTIDGTVSQASNYIKPDNRSFKIEAVLANEDGMIKPNMTAKVQINDYTSEKAILVPQNIISENADGETFLYVAEPAGKGKATAKRTIVKLGKSQGKMVEVLEGLKPGFTVIQEGARTVLDGQKVQIIKNS
tara:strand:- start:895 stop:2073 length:1179 start_codon:yes stop_codon:yes gene_type:complete